MISVVDIRWALDLTIVAAHGHEKYLTLIYRVRTVPDLALESKNGLLLVFAPSEQIQNPFSLSTLQPS